MYNRHKVGLKSKKKLKNRISEMNMIVPGNPKKIRRFRRPRANSLGHMKLTPPTSVTRRVLNRRPIASTKRKEFVDRRAWLISIENDANIRADWPLKIQMVSQCISTTVE